MMRVSEIVLGVLLAVAVFALGLLFSTQPPIHEYQLEQATAAANGEAAKIAVDERLARYTWWLAVLTGGLVLASVGQGYFLLRADKTARIAAEAAALNANVAIALESPIIRASPDRFGYSDTIKDGQQRHKVWVSAISFVNVGKTRAFPVEIQVGHTVGKTLPTIPIYPFKKSFPINVSIFDQGREIVLTEFGFDVPPDMYEQLRTEQTNLWFYCNLIYLDFMQNRHEAGFCWKRHETIGAGALRPDPTPAYNRKI